MGVKSRKSYKNTQEYIKLQSEITRLNDKLRDLYEKKRRIKFFDDKVSKINKMYLLIAVTLEIFAIIITRGALLIAQSFVVAGLGFIGLDTSKKIYEEERKLKAENPNIDIEIENTEAELKIARGNLNEYVKKKEEELIKENSLGKSKIINQSFDVDYSEELKDDKNNHSRIKLLEKKDDDN